MSAEAIRSFIDSEREPKDHNLVAEHIRLSGSKGVRYEKRPVKGEDGKPVPSTAQRPSAAPPISSPS